jgi:type II secretory pathway component PulK
MTTHPMNPVRSEKGVALIIVLLLLAVMAGLTTGLTLNGQTEIAMAHNETYYARTRAAAEAGMNRATEQILGDITTGPDRDESDSEHRQRSDRSQRRVFVQFPASGR